MPRRICFDMYDERDNYWFDNSGMNQPYNQPRYGATGMTGMNQPRYGSTGMNQPRYGSTGMNQPRYGSTGMNQPYTRSNTDMYQ